MQGHPSVDKHTLASKASSHAVLNSTMADEVNHKDDVGRTLLHQAATANDLDLVRTLLAHPKIDINEKDHESGWTALHSDGDDRKIPELVKFPYQTGTITFPKAKAARPTLLQLSMSKFHTAIATTEPGFTTKLWGFGTNGRLGSDLKMQLRPAPVLGIPGDVVFTALGRDHTVLITAKGEVYTLGNNKFGQLGYASDTPKNGQDPIQYSPKRVVLNIAKQNIKGAAASKWHTVVYTNTEIFTFGFNHGQLGYERKGDIQLGPRKIASIPPGSITQVQASDAATACLMSSNDVIVFYKYAYHKMSFSLSPYPEWFSIELLNSLDENRPQMIACSENKFGMMTKWGDIHVWSYPEVDADITLGTLPQNFSIPYSSITPPEKPRRVWTSGGDKTRVIDFALGQNGSVILLTKGGHVYIGTNKGNSIGRNVKWQRVPHLDRIVQVYANPSGAWAALRSESALTPVIVRPGTFGSDLERSLSQFYLYRNIEKMDVDAKEVDDDDDDDEDNDKGVANPWKIDTQGWLDIEQDWDHNLISLLNRATNHTNGPDRSISGNHLFDVELQAGKRVLGAHRIILAARSPVIQRAFVETPRSISKVGTLVTIEPNTGESTGGAMYTVLLKVEFTTAVLLLQFLYSDRFDPFWDALDLPKVNKQYALKVRHELRHLALELSLPTLQAALEYSFTHVCSASLSKNLGEVISNPLRCKSLADVRLLLKDGASIDAHQMVLGHRSPFFYAMFVRTDEWIRSRQGQKRLPGTNEENKDNILEVNMKHLNMESMALVMKYIYMDCGPELFYDIEKDEMDDLIQVVINVLQIADELLMDQLKEICEYILGEQVRAKTVVTFLDISLMYAAESLKVTCIDYLCHNIEMALDQRWLEGAEDDILTLVENALKGKQDTFMPYVRYGRHLPDSDKVEKMRETIKLKPQYYRLRGTYNAGVSKGARQTHEREPDKPSSISRSASLPAVPEPLPLLPTPTPSTPVNTPQSAESRASAASEEGEKLERSESASNVDTTSEWPTLSNAPVTDLRDAPSPPKKKTKWGFVPRVENVQLTLDGQDLDAKDSSSKPSLREILEQERQEHTNSSKAPAAVIAAVQKASKLSQKERRKLQQQQQASSPPPDQAQSVVQPTSPPQAWAKVPSSNDPNSVVPDGPGLLRRQSSAGSANGRSSLLEIQQSELALFRVQPKEIPRVAVATSKPVKETMRTGGSEKTFTEAPWRLDAIPEPLRAVTRHQNQMYPKPNSNSHAHSPLPTNSPLNGPLNDAGVTVAVSGMSVLTPTSGLSSLSSFAIIQNQQLRDRNMLLQARHNKKSLYQIQIEEQALAQIRMMSLDRVRGKETEGTGEWFTCEIEGEPLSRPF
ncbi:hypothetical protein BGZ65_011344 [Modicella reniformis]|uniref:BTB domain-containing protein n=1 Tax=Modicella reniformis TaxID=1440133 RepID=A0A9P6IMH7_9FUNG|nr:hypothetical protein BGZ65_011344 [Modicella reniformis]